MSIRTLGQLPMIWELRWKRDFCEAQWVMVPEWNTYIVLFEDDTRFIIMEYPTSFLLGDGSQFILLSDTISIRSSQH